MTPESKVAQGESALAAALRIERVTTRYSLTEDRLRVAGELPSGQPLVLWMTQRLLLCLLPRLFQWLEAQGAADAPQAVRTMPALYSDALQSFAQHAAVQQLAPQPPVQTQADTPEHLVESVALGQSAARVHVVFKDAQQAMLAGLALDVQSLRQWLSIVHRQWESAQWPGDVWPEWLYVTAVVGPQDLPDVLH